MNDYPIIFNGEMVRAVLDGRKTQTRRVINPQPALRDIKYGAGTYGSVTYLNGKPGNLWWHYGDRCEWRDEAVMRQSMASTYSRYGVPGDRLWVRETWGIGTRPDPFEGWYDGLEYRADEAYLDDVDLLPCYRTDFPEDFDDDKWRGQWRPSVHMPRWASRITLEVTDVHVERVQDISTKDVRAEGIQSDTYAGQAFMELWDSIYAKRGYGWDVNPWVWVIEFKLGGER